MSFKSKKPKRTVMLLIIKLILLASIILSTNGNLIGRNCTYPTPPNGYIYELKSCPSHVNFEPRYQCLVPDIMRCNEPCPGLCTAKQSTLEYCIITWTCHWRLIQDTNPTTTTLPPRSDTGLTTSTWIGIIATITIVTLAVIFVLIWYFVFKPRYGPLRDEENFNVTYQHRECEEISFNMSRSLTSLAQCLSSPELCPTF